jgi:hypothetical protein
LQVHADGAGYLAELRKRLAQLGRCAAPCKAKGITAYLKDLLPKKRHVTEASDPVPYYTLKVKRPRRTMHEAMRAGLR